MNTKYQVQRSQGGVDWVDRLGTDDLSMARRFSDFEQTPDKYRSRVVQRLDLMLDGPDDCLSAPSGVTDAELLFEALDALQKRLVASLNGEGFKSSRQETLWVQLRELMIRVEALLP